MTKILEAECSAGVVQANGFVVEADLITDGVGESSGIVLLDGETAKYIASNTEDIKDIMDSLGQVLDQIVVAMTSLDAVTTNPGSASANIALVTTLKTQMMLLKEVLR